MVYRYATQSVLHQNGQTNQVQTKTTGQNDQRGSNRNQKLNNTTQQPANKKGKDTKLRRHQNDTKPKPHSESDQTGDQSETHRTTPTSTFLVTKRWNQNTTRTQRQKAPSRRQKLSTADHPDRDLGQSLPGDKPKS